ncbi:putative membrane protein YoaS [Pullulanibacillus camelliae]|uniref:Putative membrane protein YoaS n=1 Tax=Pullulanibacillus camelliae TaxID=1707096 RepID=A0A8J2YLT7_9BACL|nr:DUF2975 domain-containing protein [Pullulanibacillus camelliae]GGE51660.1 putative membrane protein YoaS [Pullulanibacillus camelliae]
MNRVSTLFLKIAVLFIGMPILALCIFVVPHIASYAGGLYPTVSYMNILVFIVLYGAAIPFYMALFQAFKLLSFIDKNKAFSDLSVRALKHIKICATIICIWYIAALPLFYGFADKDDAPGVIIIGLIIIFASMVIAVFAAVLQKLLKEAIDIKSENDLTV